MLALKSHAKTGVVVGESRSGRCMGAVKSGAHKRAHKRALQDMSTALMLRREGRRGEMTSGQVRKADAVEVSLSSCPPAPLFPPLSRG